MYLCMRYKEIIGRNPCVEFWVNVLQENKGRCDGRPLLKAWLLPNLNTLPNKCIRENSL